MRVASKSNVFVVIAVGAIFLAGGVIYVAKHQPFVKDRMPFGFDIVRIENTTIGDPADGLPDLTIHVKNVDRDNESVQFNTENCLLVDAVPITSFTIDPPDGLLEARGKNATITIPGGGRRLGEQFTMRLVSVENWGIEGPFWVGWDVGVDGNTIS